MRHRKNTLKLGRTSEHRAALLSGLVCNLIERKRIATTLAKAKIARRLAEKMVTLGKKGTLAARRRALSILRQETCVAELFGSVAPAFNDRAGGYTRIVRTNRRSSDSAKMALLEWVNYIPKPPRKKTKKDAKGQDKAPAGDKKVKEAAK